MWANMGSHEQAVMGLESREVSVWVTKLIVTIFSKMCNACWGNLSSADSFQNQNFQKNLSRIP